MLKFLDVTPNPSEKKYGDFKVQESSSGDFTCVGLGKTISNPGSVCYLHFKAFEGFNGKVLSLGFLMLDSSN